MRSEKNSEFGIGILWEKWGLGRANTLNNHWFLYDLRFLRKLWKNERNWMPECFPKWMTNLALADFLLFWVAFWGVRFLMKFGSAKSWPKIRSWGPRSSERQSFRRPGGMRGASGQLKGVQEIEELERIWMKIRIELCAPTRRVPPRGGRRI